MNIIDNKIKNVFENNKDLKNEMFIKNTKKGYDKIVEIIEENKKNDIYIPQNEQKKQVQKKVRFKLN